MKYFKNLIVIAFVIFGLLIASNVCAFEKGGDRQKAWDQLNLSADQKKQLEENKTKNREVKKATFEQMKSSREALKAELMKPELDMDKINGIQAQIKSLQGKIADNHLNSILEVRKILTREQFEKFLELSGKHKRWEK